MLAQTLQILHTPADEALPPLTSGMVGYLAYDAVRRLEVLPDDNVDDLGLPELVMMLVSDMAIIDHHTGEVWLVANAINFDDAPERAEQAWSDARDRVHAMAETLSRPAVPLLAVLDEGRGSRRAAPEYTRAVHGRRRVSRRRDQGWRGVFRSCRASGSTCPPTPTRSTSTGLRRTNPSPYLYLLRAPGLAVVGSSPEALVTVQNGRAETHPIAGSRPRGQTAADDVALEAELLADPKERAEHLMLVDLGRNDLGRVCAPGTSRWSSS